MSEHAFCRALLAEVMVDIRQLTTAKDRAAVWTCKTFNQYEFHGPDGFYWHGQACCAWHARVKGWEAWEKQETTEAYERAVEDCEAHGD